MQRSSLRKFLACRVWTICSFRWNRYHASHWWFPQRGQRHSVSIHSQVNHQWLIQIRHGQSPWPSPSAGNPHNLTIVPSGNARLPLSKIDSAGAHFPNITAADSKPIATGASHASVTGASQGKPKPSACRLKNKTASISPSGHLPYTKTAGLVFTNSTGPHVQTKAIHPSGTGGFAAPSDHTVHIKPTVVSSGFARPSEHLNSIRPAATKSASGTDRLPLASGKGAFLGSSTTVVSVGPTGTGGVPTFSSKIPASGHLPYSHSKGSAFTNSTSDLSSPSTSFEIFPSGTGSAASIPTIVGQVNATSTTNQSSVTTASLGFSSIPTLSTVSVPYANSTVLIPTRLPSSSTSPSATIVAEYYQCGGINYKGSKTCVEGTVCKDMNPYYSQCVQE